MEILVRVGFIKCCSTYRSKNSKFSANPNILISKIRQLLPVDIRQVVNLEQADNTEHILDFGISAVQNLQSLLSVLDSESDDHDLG